MLISYLEVCQEGGVKKGGTWRTLGVPNRRCGEDLVIPDVMNDDFLPQGGYLENFMLISQLKVCQEGGVKKGFFWRMLRVPDLRHGGQGHS